MPDTTHAHRGPPQREWVLIIVLSALTAMAPVSIDMYLPALPALAQDLATTPAGAQLTLSAFMLGFGGGQIIYGPLADRYGRRVPLAVGLALAVAASIGCALARSLDALIVWRFVQALGGCAGPVLARAIVRDLYERDRMARVLSLMTMVMSVAPIAAPLIGGQLLLHGSWRAVFWTLAGFGALCLVGSLALLRETLPPEHRARLPLSALVRAYIEPLKNRRFLGYAFTGAFVYAGMFAYISGSPFVFISLYGVPPQYYGLLFGLNVVGIMIATALNGRMVMRAGADHMLRGGTVLAAVSGCLLLLAGASGWGGLPGLAVPLFFFIGSIGFIGANSVAGALMLFAQQRAGMASALLGTLQFFFGALGAVLVAAFNDGTALPMTAVIALAGIGSLLVRQVLHGAPRRKG